VTYGKQITGEINKEETAMKKREMEAALEAVLFAMGQAVPLASLARSVEQDQETTKMLLHKMMERYEKEDRGIRLLELENSFQFCTKKEYYENLIRVASEPKKQELSESALEALSIIAYKQPVTKAEIQRIRGVASDHAVNRLVEFGLVCEVGRLDAPGRPILFATTEEFLRRFGVGSLEELPRLDEEKIRTFEREAAAEAQGRLTPDV